MKRALVHNPYWDSLGGGERYVATFIKLLLDQGWQVDLDWPEDISQKILDRFSIDISKVTYILHPRSYIYDLSFWLSDGSLPTSYAKKTIIHFQIPFQNVHGTSPLNYLKSRFYTFVSNSGFTKKIIDQEFSIASRVIYPPVDVDKFSPTQKKTNSIIYVGRFSNLTQSKGHELLISQFKKIQSQIPSWRLVLMGGTKVGTAPDHLADLKKQAAGERIDFVFDPDFPTLKKNLESAKIFWSASGFSTHETLPPASQEHFGISLVEAMAAGCVPVVPNLGGHPEIVDSSSGFLYDSLSQLESFTLGLVRDKSAMDKLSKNAIQKSQHFSVEVFNDSFEKLI